MKKFITLILCFFCYTVFSQMKILGTVSDENDIPLEGAAVYINNSSIGTYSDNKGNFYLNLTPGRYDLIISYIGFEPVQLNIDTKTQKEPILIKLQPKTVLLSEVIISRRKKMSQYTRKRYTRLFKYFFLGDSRLARSCRIENENILEFDYDDTSKIFEVYANEPIQITHRGLGYKIFYDLVNFEITSTNITYEGYVRYEEISGSEDQKKRWIENRKNAYLGSVMHFLRSVRNNEVQEQGFLIDVIQRKRNPEYPTPREIYFAKETFQKRREGKEVKYLQSKKGELDYYKAITIFRRKDKDQFKERLLQRNIKAEQFTIENDGIFYLDFSNHLRVTYLREKPDRTYINPKKLQHQVSAITLLKEKAALDNLGDLEEPLDIQRLGYWAFEKVGDAVPLDYKLTTQKNP